MIYKNNRYECITDPPIDLLKGGDKCQMCKQNHAEELHSCPYAEDINGDYDTLCNCCHECSRQCAEDI